MNSSEKKSEKKILNRKFIEQLLDNRRNHKPNRTLCTRLMIARTFCKSIRRINMMTIKLFFLQQQQTSEMYTFLNRFWFSIFWFETSIKSPCSMKRHIQLLIKKRSTIFVMISNLISIVQWALCLESRTINEYEPYRKHPNNTIMNWVDWHE